MTSLAFGTEVNVDGIAIEGIEAITLEDIRNASELGYKIKLLGVAVRHEGGVEQRVHPTLVPQRRAHGRYRWRVQRRRHQR